jgi:curved DNA-binding protein CbpA
MVVGGDPRGYYRVLGVDRTASAEDIRAAFRERAKLYHPDGGGGPAAGGARRFQHLREAYDVLRDPRHRLRYDAEGLADGARDRRARPRPDWPGREDPSAGAGPRFRAAVDRASAAAGRLDPRHVVAALAVLASALLVSLVLLGAAWRQLGGDGGPAVADFAGGGDPVVHHTELSFPGGSTELDAGLERRLDGAVGDLRRAIGALPAESRWVVVVEGSAARAADGAGLLVDSWQEALLQVGLTTDYLVRHGVPGERIAVRFAAGAVPEAPLRSPPGMIGVSLLCCLTAAAADAG